MGNLPRKKILAFLLLAAPLGARGEGSDRQKASDLLTRIETLAQSRNVTIKNKNWSWSELQAFQSELLEAMALDPAMLGSEYIPGHLEPVFMTEALEQKLKRLVESRNIAVKFGAGAEFDEYVKQVDEIFALRKQRLYRMARLIAKKGLLEGKFLAVADQMQKNADPGFEIALSWNEDDREEILSSLQEMASLLAPQAGKEPAHLRGPASIAETELTPERLQWVKRLLPVLLFLVFVTGLIAGYLWRREPNG